MVWSALNITEERRRSSAEAQGADEDDDDDEKNTDDDEVPLAERILDVIDACRDREIRPGRLANELGMSIEEASAELSYLLAAVGGGYDGATFRFEDVTTTTTTTTTPTKTMVFTFPADFRRRLTNRQRREDWQRVGYEIIQLIVKLIKIITAFGLILSLFILSIAALIGLVGAMIALTRVEGGHRHRSLLMHQVRAIVYALKEILWLYAVFGPTTTTGDGDDHNDQGGDPFFKEVAYDMYLFFSLCCGNPASIFFWLRANQWQSRRRRHRGTMMMLLNRQHPRGTFFASDVPGVTLVSNNNNNRWNTDDSDDILPVVDASAPTSSHHHHHPQQQRGFLSVVVEFLFGPTPFPPGPSPYQVGLLRSAVLTQLSYQNAQHGGSITLAQLAPYVDYPPKSLDDVPTIVQQGLLIVSYFHGVPSPHSVTGSSPTQASFCFPELCAESSTTTTLSRDWFHSKRKKKKRFTELHGTMFHRIAALLYDAAPPEEEASFTSSSTATGRNNRTISDDVFVPSFLQEDLYQLTRLTPQQFYQCVGLGTLNLVGVLWLRQSFLSSITTSAATTTTGINSSSGIQVVVGQILIPLLLFYAVLFFALPLGRFVLVVIWSNQYRLQRNQRRQALSQQLLLLLPPQSKPFEVTTTTSVLL